MTDTSQGISVGDAVLTFLGDTTPLDQGFDKTEARAQQWAGNVDQSISGTSASFAKAGVAATEFGGEAEAAGEKAGGSMREARGAIALLGEEVGVHVPRHLQTFIAGLPGVQTAMSAAFAPVAIFALIEIGGKLIEKIKEIAGHAQEVSEAWKKVEDDADAAFTHTGDEILRVEAQIDELNGNKLAALEKNLELIDHASLANLSKQIQQIEKDTDDALTKMHTWWDWVTTLGEGNAGIDAAKADFDEIAQKWQKILTLGSEHPDPLSGLKTSLDNAKQKVAELQAKQASAGKEQKAVLQEQIDAETRRIAFMDKAHADLLREQDDLAALNSKRDQQAKSLETLAAEGNRLAGAAANELAGTEKSIDAKNRELESLKLIAAQQLINLKLEQDQTDLATGKSGKGKDRSSLVQKENEAILQMQKSFGDALFELQKDQELRGVEIAEQGYSLDIQAGKMAFAQQLSMLANAELQKQAIIVESAEKQYQLELATKQQELKNLQAQGGKTVAEQIKVGGEIEKLQTEHQAKLLAIGTAGMEALRKVMSQPIPLINELPPGTDQLDDEITKGFRDAADAAQALGITLHGDLDAGIKSVFDNYSKLQTLFKQGIITEHDLVNAQKQVIKSEIEYGVATGASNKAITTLKQQLRDLINEEIQHAKATHASTQEIKALENELNRLDNRTKQAKGVTKDYISELRQDLSSGAGAWQQFTDVADAAMAGMEAAIGSSFAAMISGQESFGKAMEQATFKMIASLAQQYAEYYIALGIARIWDEPAAGAADLAAGALLEAIAGTLNGLASSSSSAKSSPASKGTAGPAAGSAAATAGHAPSQGLNTTHLGTGGIVSEPTLAVIGDGPSGGSGEEAIIPLSDRQAMQKIAGALMPELMKAASSGVHHDTPQIGGSPFFTFPASHNVPANPTSLLSPSTVAAAAPQQPQINHALDSFYKLMDGITHGKYSLDHQRQQRPQELHLKVETNIPAAVKLIAPELSRQVNRGEVKLLSSDSIRNTHRS